MPESAIAYVKFLRGTPVAYKNLATKDEDTLYFISNPGDITGQLYIGDKLVSADTTPSEGVAQYLSDLRDVTTAGVQGNEVLAWSSEEQTWKPMSITELMDSAGDFTGATPTDDGTSGFVPAPKAGQQNYFLRGDGTWSPVSSAGSTETLAFEVTVKPEQTHLEAIAEAVGSTELQNGDIAIVKQEIGTETNKFAYTAYIYNETSWVPMDGNYSADNVYFDSDLIFTSSIGSVEIDETGLAILPAKGKSLKEILNSLFTEEKQPEILTEPSISLSVTKAGDYEVGTVVSGIQYTASFEDGSYSYGPEPTGSTISTWNITTSDGKSFTEATGALPDVTVTDDLELTISATANYTDANFAKTNLGNETEIQIKAGTASFRQISVVSGYRNIFYGTKTSNITETEITNEMIRSLTPTGKKLEKNESFVFEIPLGARSVVIAIPASVDNSISIIDCLDGSDLFTAGSFKVKTIPIEGANQASAVDYNVYYINFAFDNNIKNKYLVRI